MKHLFRLVPPLAALFLTASPAARAAAPDRPNVLLILADDMGYSDLGCYGGEIATPNLDGLARNGLRFTQFYNTARCWPTRGAILTGYYAQQIRRDTVPGVQSGGRGVRPTWARLLPEMLKPLGYRSYHSGKWHIDGMPLQNGFDRSYSLDDHDRHFTPRRHTEDDEPLPPVEAKAGYYSTTAIADHAIKCLKEHAEEYADHPFFEFLAFTAPHFPLQAPAEDIARYRERYLAGWDLLREERWERLKDLQIGGTALAAIEREVGPPYAFPDAIEKLGPNELNRPVPWKELSDDQRRFQANKMAIHAAMVDRMDREIGRVVEQLREMKALDNTLIFFLSDNGASAEIMVRGDGHDPEAECGTGATFLSIGPGWSSLANTPFRRHKTWVHEGGISTPLIVHWPDGIAARGDLRRTPGHVVDIVPTILEAVGGKRFETWDDEPLPLPPGKSLAPLFANDGNVERESLWWLHEGNRALRVGDWKIVAAGNESAWELYDMNSERSESRNLAGEQPEKVRELVALWTNQFDEFAALAAKDVPLEPVKIGLQRELFVDDALIERLAGKADLRLHHPVPQNVAVVADEPWEGNATNYVTVFRDGETYRMYYRGSHFSYLGGKDRPSTRDLYCYAESPDGVHWKKPELGLFAWNDSKKNNIVWDGVGAHAFVPFRDTNPKCAAEKKYKALGVGGPKQGLYAFQSADAIHWSLMHPEPVITKGAFDSQNLAFWDSERGEYREYHRDFRDGRDIRTGTSPDFLHWSEPEYLTYTANVDPGRREGQAADVKDPVGQKYPSGRVSELYTNQIAPYYRAPQILLGFPTRYIDRGWTESAKALPRYDYRQLRAKGSPREGTAVTDGMLIASRDRRKFSVWPESFLRPGLRTRDSWFYGDTYQNWGLVETKSAIDDAPPELSLYVTERTLQETGGVLRRYTLRIDGFVSLHAPLAGGELITTLVAFAGNQLTLNVSTSAAGSVRVEIQSENGQPYPGFALADCQEVYGDDLDRTVVWGANSDLGSLAGKPVRLRFEVKDADLYSYRFRDGSRVAAADGPPAPELAPQATASAPVVKVVDGGESIVKPEECRSMVLGPGMNQPEPFPGYGGFVGWVSPIRLKGGDLLLGFSAGYWHASPPTPLRYSQSTIAQYLKIGLPADVEAPRGGRALIMRSADAGKTWSKPATMLDTPDDDRHPAFVELPDGTVICSLFTYSGAERADFLKNPELAHRTVIIRSFDHGKTWEQEMIRPPSPFLADETDGPLVLLKDGSILLTISGTPKEGGPTQTAVFTSRDRGASWKLLATIKSDHDLDEANATQLADERLVLMARPEGDIAWSSDLGRTWTAPATFGVRLYAPSLYALRDGTLVCLHGSYAPGHGGLRLIFSTDGGRTWIAPAKDHGFLVDNCYGYGKAVVLPDGTLLVVDQDTGGHATAEAKKMSLRLLRVRIRADHSGIDLLPPNE